MGMEKWSLQEEDTNFGVGSDATPAQGCDGQSHASLEGLKEDSENLSLLGTSLVQILLPYAKGEMVGNDLLFCWTRH